MQVTEAKSMSEEAESRIWDLLKEVRFRGMSRDIVSFGFVESVQRMSI